MNRYFRKSKRITKIEIFIRQCKLGDWFVLYQLSKNLNRPFFVDFLTHLSIRYTESGGKLDEEDPEETENHSQLLRPSYTPKSNDYGIDRVDRNTIRRGPIDPDEKEEYMEAAQRDKIRAATEKARYDELHKDDPVDGRRRKRKKKRKLPGEPKRALSAYMQFAQLKRSEIVEMYPGRQPKEIMSLLGEKWRGLDEDGKAEYVELAERDKIRYQREMAIFRNKGVAHYEDDEDDY